MLNELSDLTRSLAARGIQTQAWHPWIQPFKKGEAIIAELGDSGQLARVSLLSAEEVSHLRNIKRDNHNSFPGFNLNCPLMATVEGVRWDQPEETWQAAARTTPESPLAYEPEANRRVERLLSDFPLNEVAPRLKGDRPKLKATLDVLRRLAEGRPKPEAFLSQFALQVVAAAQQGRLSHELARSILYGKPNKKKQTLESWQLTVIFDVADLDRYDYRVADPSVAAEWSRLLLAHDSAPGENAPVTFICNLTGQLDGPMGDKMPSPNLKVLGPTFLMSMNAAIPCQTRYGQISMDIFHVGKSAVQSLNDALLFITEPGRRDKTWANVPNGSNDQGDLLITYLEEEPDSDIPVSGLFADMESDAEHSMSSYEARTARIHEALRLRERSGQDLHIKVIALSKIDKGRTQVVFSGRYSTSAIFKGRDRWLAGAQNAPSVAIPFPVRKGEPAIWRSSDQPTPANVMASFKLQWLRAGQTSQTVPGVDLDRIYALLLEPDAKVQASWLLGRYLGLTEPLLRGLARSLSGGPSLPESARKESLIVIAVYGILLLRQGRTKEIYMESRDYLLGQFLQMADLLHKLYCVHERKGDIPPQLIGNAAIQMACQSPKRALEVLSNRMPVYLAWADRYHGEGAGLSKWCRKELGRLSAALKSENLDSRVSSNGKAELLLGYLATKTGEKQENSI